MLSRRGTNGRAVRIEKFGLEIPLPELCLHELGEVGVKQISAELVPRRVWKIPRWERSRCTLWRRRGILQRYRGLVGAL